jgi:glycosyltransferase involved in cell wall biosynthesis
MSITFIIPSLSRPSLPKTIESLLKQTNPSWKCIIIYDGVNGSDFEDPRIETMSIPKTGIDTKKLGQSGLVRNYGIKKCNTEWIGFLDDDDTIHPDYVKTLFEKYTSYDFVVWRMRNNNGLVIPRWEKNELVINNVGISFCYKNKFGDLLFDSNINGEDFYFVDKLQKRTSNFTITQEVFYFIRH